MLVLGHLPIKFGILITFAYSIQIIHSTLRRNFLQENLRFDHSDNINYAQSLKHRFKEWFPCASFDFQEKT